MKLGLRLVGESETLPYSCESCGAFTPVVPCPLCGHRSFETHANCSGHHCMTCGDCLPCNPDEEAALEGEPGTWAYEKARIAGRYCEACKEEYRATVEARRRAREKRSPGQPRSPGPGPSGSGRRSRPARH